MSSLVVFERNGYQVIYSDGVYTLVGETVVTGHVTRDGYRRSYGPDKAKAIAACKRKGGAGEPAARKPREYMGVIIWPASPNSAGIRWEALGYGRADTLTGMKALIRDAQ